MTCGLWGIPRWPSGKELPAKEGDARDMGSIPESGRSPRSRKRQPTPVFLPGEFHGQRSLAGCSPWGHKESDMTEHAMPRSRMIRGLSVMACGI